VDQNWQGIIAQVVYVDMLTWQLSVFKLFKTHNYFLPSMSLKDYNSYWVEMQKGLIPGASNLRSIV
jgi:hypothetical protein